MTFFYHKKMFAATLRCSSGKALEDAFVQKSLGINLVHNPTEAWQNKQLTMLPWNARILIKFIIYEFIKLLN